MSERETFTAAGKREGPSDPSPVDVNGNGRQQIYLEIDTGRSKRWRGLVGYLVIVLAVMAVLVWMFIQFTGSMKLAVLLVGFMMAYMATMGWLASGKIDRRR